LPEDLIIDQRKKLLLGPEAQLIQMTCKELGETRTGPAERMMAIDAESDYDFEEEFPSANHRKIAQKFGYGEGSSIHPEVEEPTSISSPTTAPRQVN